jgi:hypothetical protein
LSYFQNKKGLFLIFSPFPAPENFSLFSRTKTVESAINKEEIHRMNFVVVALTVNRTLAQVDSWQVM